MSADNMHGGSRAVQASAAPSASEAVVLDRLAELSRLTINWDSYGGVPPTETAVNVAHQLMTTASWLSGDGNSNDEPAEISPVPDGGLLLAWCSDTREVQLRVNRDGALDVLLVDLTHAEPRYEEHTISVASKLSPISSDLSVAPDSGDAPGEIERDDFLYHPSSFTYHRLLDDLGGLL